MYFWNYLQSQVQTDNEEEHHWKTWVGWLFWILHKVSHEPVALIILYSTSEPQNTCEVRFFCYLKTTGVSWTLNMAWVLPGESVGSLRPCCSASSVSGLPGWRYFSGHSGPLCTEGLSRLLGAGHSGRGLSYKPDIFKWCNNRQTRT